MNEFLVLLILVLSETVLKQQLLSFTEPLNQEQLTGVANKLNAQYSGLTGSQIAANRLETTSEERRITDVVTEMMATEDEMEYHQSYLEGLRLMLGQPEFIEKDRMLSILELMEARDWLDTLLRRKIEHKRVQIVIGEENRDKTLKDLSLVLGRYGIPKKMGGTIGVIGPTRMDYRKAISTVNYMSGILSYLVAGVCEEE
jgi:heat-inducible transcriptional repressor